MYEVFYDFKAEPFRLSPDHRFCFDHKCYAKARAYLTYAFMRAEGFVMITGSPGTGKTTLIGELIESLAEEKVNTANLVCTQLQADDLLKITAYSFGVDSGVVQKGEILQHLGALLQRWHREGSRALLIVDEAQDLSESAMEELRLLTNIQENGKPLLQIFLLGQPELRDLVLSPRMQQVHQRIVAASHLEALESDETEAYIIHRLAKVGWHGNPALSKTIFPLIYKFSEGVPRRINLICSRLFLHACVEQRHRIGVADLQEVIRELQFEKLAAGTLFADADFQLEDEYPEQAPTSPDEDAALSDGTVDDVDSGESPRDADPEHTETAEAAEQAYEQVVGDEIIVQIDEVAGKLDAENEKKNEDIVALRPAALGLADVASFPQNRTPRSHAEEKSPGALTASALERAARTSDSNNDSAQQDVHRFPAANESQPLPGADTGEKPHKPSRAEPGHRNRKIVAAVLLIFILALLVTGWLIFDPDLDDIRAWRDQAVIWWKSVLDRAR